MEMERAWILKESDHRKLLTTTLVVLTKEKIHDLFVIPEQDQPHHRRVEKKATKTTSWGISWGFSRGAHGPRVTPGKSDLIRKSYRIKNQHFTKNIDVTKTLKKIH